MMDISEIDVAAFEENYRSSRMYHFRARQFLEEGQQASVVFNVASVALENYLIALCLLYGIEPENHNYICLMEAVEAIDCLVVSPELNQSIRSLDQIFGICSLENYFHGAPEVTDMVKVLELCEAVAELFDPIRIGDVRRFAQQQKESCPT
ncbi:hypothetical protein [Propionispora hippei]|uniref:HEPN domain-containing protein n=1 Tax=Propionispora hippei DSM 15287 TaxID=1123003 RepID=A0A1M6CW70_9FIRM|nr:hypothetical protein [Propionispora hippei]SHI65091.1 hypothetical protein SAMN02745170_00757 [Propionispora hippei DSM 15287]